MDQKYLDRFHSRYQINEETGCWLWTAGRHCKTDPATKEKIPTYGAFYAGKQIGDLYAHRASYLIHHGAIPDGMSVRHSCHNPGCVNPSHLSLGTQTDNMKDMRDAGRAREQNGYKHSQVTRTKMQASAKRRKSPSDGALVSHSLISE